ncbi:MAG: hypothetical protein GX417_08185 [Clostridiales bacterium]|nr:hypothetical protein [Clostridiales bacterium]
MKRREMKLLLEERFERIALLETRIDTMDQLVEGYRAREQAILDTLQSAQQTAAKTLEGAKTEAEQLRKSASTETEQARSAIKMEAEQIRAALKAETEQTRAAAVADAERARTVANAEAGQVRSAARREAETLLSETKETAKALRTEAEHHVRELLASAKADSERTLREAEHIKNEYEEIIDAFNTLIEQNASELQVTAVRFAEFMERCKIRLPEHRGGDSAPEKSAGAADAAMTDLPDPTDDPSQLMQNIYRIQKRPLPEETLGVHLAGGAGADGRTSVTAEPYSEAAWKEDAFESKSEEQAEFVKTFDGAYAASDFVVQADGCHLTQADAEQALDALLTSPGFETDAGAIAAPAAAAFNTLAYGAGGARRTEAEQAFDELFDGDLKPDKESAADKAADAGEQAGPTPEPYSEAAWTQETFTSDHEPQAEFAKTFDNAYAESDYVVPANECELPQADASAPKSEEVSAAEATAEEQMPQAEEKPAENQSGVTSTEAERAFDEYFSNFGQPEMHAEEAEPVQTGDDIQAETPTAAEEAPAQSETQTVLDEFYAIAGEPAAPAPAPEPYSEAAWAQETFTSDHEPQAEGGLFNVEPAAEPEAEAGAGPETKTDEAAAPSETQAALNEFYAIAGEPAAPAPAPEPYSEAAWAQDAFTSGHEPQAEGGLFGAEEPGEEPEPESKPRYNEYGEVREWEPEPEPEMEEIPTVSSYVGQSGDGEEISLDDLLNEIIKAGE